MNLKGSVLKVFGIESKFPKLVDSESHAYDPSDWNDRNPELGATRVVRTGGGVRTCSFPVPTDADIMPSYFKYVANVAAERAEFVRSLGAVAGDFNPQN